MLGMPWRFVRFGVGGAEVGWWRRANAGDIFLFGLRRGFVNKVIVVVLW